MSEGSESTAHAEGGDGGRQVLAEKRGAVLLLTLNRPDRLNAWTREMWNRYMDLLANADGDPDVRAIVVTGAGRGFCAGADFDVLAAEYQPGKRPMTFPLTIRKPLIAAINGPVAGIGLAVALYCDVRFAADDAKLLTAFSRRGLTAEHGLAWHLPRLVGAGRALDLLLSSRVVLGGEAQRIGLVDHVLPKEQVLDAALAYAEDLATNCSPTSMATIKGQVYRAFETGFGVAVAEADRLMAESFVWPDVQEGLASYDERRPPAFPPLDGRRD